MADPSTTRDLIKLIKPHMPVVCSEDGQFATVDHLEGSDMIKLTRDDRGQHHFIPLAWVTAVDDKVHIDRPGKQAMKEWSTEPGAEQPAEQPEALQVPTSTDETRGQPLAARVHARVVELETALADLGPDTLERREIELALATAASLTTGDMTHPSDVVASQLSEWLERNRYLAIKAAETPRRAAGEKAG